AKRQDLSLSNGQSFEDFLRTHNISEEQYNRAVVSTAVYRVVASKHVPDKGTSEQKTNAFTSWICDTRKSYDVKINLTFNVQGNQPCTSGLPAELPTGDDQQPPEPEATGAATALPMVPRNTPVPGVPTPVKTQAAP